MVRLEVLENDRHRRCLQIARPWLGAWGSLSCCSSRLYAQVDASFQLRRATALRRAMHGTLYVMLPLLFPPPDWRTPGDTSPPPRPPCRLPPRSCAVPHTRTTRWCSPPERRDRRKGALRLGIRVSSTPHETRGRFIVGQRQHPPPLRTFPPSLRNSFFSGWAYIDG